MSDSDSGPELADTDDITLGAKLIYAKNNPFIALQPPEVIYERWMKIPVHVKLKAAEMMNVCAFWHHIVLHQEGHHTTRWAVQVGFLDSNISGDLSLKRVRNIEILEAALRAMAKGTLLEDQTRHLIWISNKFNLHAAEVLDDAMCWLERTGEPRIRQRVQELGHRGICYNALQVVFTEYAHYTQAMGVCSKRTMKEMVAGQSAWSSEKSQEFKSKGNDQFQKKKYDAAIKHYSKAIKYHPENHIIYGNRALCYIRCEKYLKAVGDGKRSVLISPTWAKGHYRYCEALFLIGEHKWALESNLWAQSVCKDDSEGMRDLHQQYGKFTVEMAEIRLSEVDGIRVGGQKKATARKVSSKRPESATRTDTRELRQQSVKPSSKTQGSVVEMDSQATPGKNEEGAPLLDDTKGPEEMKSEMAYKTTSKPELSVSEKQKVKTRNQQSNKKTVSGSYKQSVYEALKSVVKDAHTALADQRSRNAEHAFSQALSMLEGNTAKELGISMLDRVVLMYGRASALIEIGQPEELAEAGKELELIKSYEQRKFQCLVYYSIGKVYLKENRFQIALKQFSDSLQMVRKQITPGKLTWPTTKDIVKETQPDYFKGLLEKFIEMCKFPPKPDAICRHQNGPGHSKIEIYFTDPDFKGFIRMICCQSCTVEYHISCWKTLKAASFSDKNEKEFLQEMCFTPDCGGRICSIKIYGSTGLIKCKFESPVIKPMGTVKLRVNQECTSLKKLNSKEDRKLRRKQHQQAASLEKQDEKDLTSLAKDKNDAVESAASSPTWLIYGDRVLLQISENKELFRDESHNISALMKVLKPWIDLDRLKGNELAMLVYEERQPGTLWEVVELLLERKNRVWARVFIHSLSGCLDTNPRLHDWAHQLDNAGLNAAGQFINRYAEHLEELDLGPLLMFPPLQDMLIEKFGTMPKFFSRVGLTVTEYLKQAPPQEMRLFIWTLEEHKEQYATCHAVLDEYFEMMDGLCLVIKKTEKETENRNKSPIKTRNRNRKKKQKDPKSVILMSGMRGGTPRDEEEEDYFDDSLMFLNPSDSFSVPNHLRDQVAEFEGRYNTTNHISHFKRILDNNLDPAKESLYDYFAQILEEHGPLEPQDPLLVGEIDNFPPDAQEKIQAAGGLKHFLLESLRFVVMSDNLIGLMKHAVSLQEVTVENPHRLDDLDFIGDDPYGSDLKPSAIEFLSYSQNAGLGDINSEVGYYNEPFELRRDPVMLTSHHKGYSHKQSVVCPGLPNPYTFDSHASQSALSASGVAGASGIQREDGMLYDGTACAASANQPHCPEKLGDIYLYNDADEQGGWEPVIVPQKRSKETAAVQVSFHSTGHVAVNTEPYEPFERNNGDLTKKQKGNLEFEEQIRQMENDYDAVKQKRREDISALEVELEEVHHKIQITNKELGLFQQKLEEEVKKDQQEKKDNQETLKALKNEIKELAEYQESSSKSIRENNKEYETHLNTFLELSNQSAAEKMSLEDEIKRCRDLCDKSIRRSQAAELSILENRRGRGLRCLYRSQSDARAILAKLKELAPRYPPQMLQSGIDSWRVCVKEAEEKITTTEAQYQEQMEQVKKGTRLCTLPLVTVPSAPQPPPVPILYPTPPLPQLPRHPVTHHPYMQVRAPMYGHPGAPRAPPAPASAQSEHPGHVGPPPGLAGVSSSTNAYANVQSGPANMPVQVEAQVQAQALQYNSVFEKILDRLSSMFPHYSRPILSKFIQDIRSANGGALNSLSYQEVINRVAQLILDHQDSTREQMNYAGRIDPGVYGGQPPLCGSPPCSDSPGSIHSTETPPLSHWKSVGAHGRLPSKALNMEDPCIICHEDMCKEDVCVLECRHSFHRECIKSWLREQSTCPTCREHALLPEDFPMLPGRVRRGHTPAAFS